MDIVGLIKKSYRGYGSLFSDKFREAFLKGDSRNVNCEFIFVCCCSLLKFSIDFSS